MQKSGKANLRQTQKKSMVAVYAVVYFAPFGSESKTKSELSLISFMRILESILAVRRLVGVSSKVMAGVTVWWSVALSGLLRAKISFATIKNCNRTQDIIQRHHPEACAIEDGFLATNVKVTLKLGQVRGVAMLVAERAALDIHEYSPRLVKQTVVGHGNAEKFQVQQMVKTLLSLASVPEPEGRR